jgi:50S ribosomal protein L16 3-hydroxylase
MDTKLTLLGGLTVNEFLRDYWQKKPLLVRNAIPGFKGLLDPQQLIKLACRDDVQARLVTHQRKQWKVRYEPFVQEDFEGLSKKGKWSVLVQGVNHFLPTGTELAQKFSFIPHARLDDLMVSYAPKGGGVGPHFDVYDVFLVQGLGHRRWQISTQKDQTLVEGAPIRLLKDFRVEQEWVVEAGDLLYLPPHCAHNGIAEDDCMSYSIGFRTPWHQELAEQFLVYLQDRIEIKGTYADPDLKAQKHPSEIGPDMLQQVSRTIRKVKWDDEDVANFLGCYLSEPKPHIFFDNPTKPLAAERFMQAVQKNGLKLDLKALMLCHGNSVFINGDAYPVGAGCYRILRELADTRTLPSSCKLTREASNLLYQWYLDGFVIPGEK